jgi:hypothetical protein
MNAHNILRIPGQLCTTYTGYQCRADVVVYERCDYRSDRRYYEVVELAGVMPMRRLELPCAGYMTDDMKAQCAEARRIARLWANGNYVPPGMINVRRTAC